jgi:cell division protein FtsW (lipid II flippase)
LTGITLPFISAGGSSLVANFLVGLLLHISGAGAEDEAEAVSTGPSSGRPVEYR